MSFAATDGAAMPTHCACGAPAIAFKPGTAPDRVAIGAAVVAVSDGERGECWCFQCWPYRHQAAWNRAMTP